MLSTHGYFKNPVLKSVVFFKTPSATLPAACLCPHTMAAYAAAMKLKDKERAKKRAEDRAALLVKQPIAAAAAVAAVPRLRDHGGNPFGAFPVEIMFHMFDLLEGDDRARLMLALSCVYFRDLFMPRFQSWRVAGALEKRVHLLARMAGLRTVVFTEDVAQAANTVDMVVAHLPASPLRLHIDTGGYQEITRTDTKFALPDGKLWSVMQLFKKLLPVPHLTLSPCILCIKRVIGEREREQLITVLTRGNFRDIRLMMCPDMQNCAMEVIAAAAPYVTMLRHDYYTNTRNPHRRLAVPKFPALESLLYFGESGFPPGWEDALPNASLKLLACGECVEKTFSVLAERFTGAHTLHLEEPTEAMLRDALELKPRRLFIGSYMNSDVAWELFPAISAESLETLVVSYFGMRIAPNESGQRAAFRAMDCPPEVHVVYRRHPSDVAIAELDDTLVYMIQECSRTLRTLRVFMSKPVKPLPRATAAAAGALEFSVDRLVAQDVPL